ncbi:hypothetical protein ABK040_004564 [Willaertia magna]
MCLSGWLRLLWWHSSNNTSTTTDQNNSKQQLESTTNNNNSNSNDNNNNPSSTTSTATTSDKNLGLTTSVNNKESILEKMHLQITKQLFPTTPITYSSEKEEEIKIDELISLISSDIVRLLPNMKVNGKFIEKNDDSIRSLSMLLFTIFDFTKLNNDINFINYFPKREENNQEEENINEGRSSESIRSTFVKILHLLYKDNKNLESFQFTLNILKSMTQQAIGIPILELKSKIRNMFNNNISHNSHQNNIIHVKLFDGRKWMIELEVDNEKEPETFKVIHHRIERFCLDSKTRSEDNNALFPLGQNGHNNQSGVHSSNNSGTSSSNGNSNNNNNNTTIASSPTATMTSPRGSMEEVCKLDWKIVFEFNAKRREFVGVKVDLVDVTNVHLVSPLKELMALGNNTNGTSSGSNSNNGGKVAVGGEEEEIARFKGSIVNFFENTFY